MRVADRLFNQQLADPRFTSAHALVRHFAAVQGQEYGPTKWGSHCGSPVPPMPVIDRDEALSQLTRSYFRSRGPATARDFSTWSSLTVTDCRREIAMHASRLVRQAGDGEPLFGPRGRRRTR